MFDTHLVPFPCVFHEIAHQRFIMSSLIKSLIFCIIFIVNQKSTKWDRVTDATCQEKIDKSIDIWPTNLPKSGVWKGVSHVSPGVEMGHISVTYPQKTQLNPISWPYAIPPYRLPPSSKLLRLLFQCCFMSWNYFDLLM